MIKKALVLALAVVGFAASHAAAANMTSAGCGLGSMIFDNKTAKVQLILAATTNGSFGNQTFGISSDTLGCTSNGVVRNDRKVEAFAEANLRDLSRDVARGGGESLAGLAVLMGKSDAKAQGDFYKLAQANYEKLFPAQGTTPSQFVATLRTL